MPRQPRIHVPGAFYHVTLRGNHRQDIFFTPTDRQLLEGIIGEVIERFQARLHAYCWMTNHVHLLIQIGDVPLGRLILRIAGRYARTVQQRFHTTGHLFERRYHSILIDADEYLLKLLRYIHLNPVRACMVNAAADYIWSSHVNYLGLRAQSWVTTDFALRMFHAERELAVAAYRRFMEMEAGESSDSPSTLCNPNDSRILGSDQFLAKLLGRSWQPRSDKSLADLIDEACQQFSVSRQALVSASRHRHITHVRAWIAHQAVTLRVASLSEVARSFGRTEASLRESVKHHFNFP